jgi:hypothetical protein
MKSICSVVIILATVGCAETKVSGGSGNPLNPLSGSNQNASNSSGKPYMSEILRRYSTPGKGSEPYGLWNLTETITSEDESGTIDIFMRITKDSVSDISACLNNETKKYVISATTANVVLKENGDGSYSYSVSRPIETMRDSNGIKCRSWLLPRETFIKVDERGIMLIKHSGDVQLREWQRVK